MPRVFIAESGAEFGQMRKLLGISLRSLAGEIGISQTTLARWEASNRPLDQARLERWGDAMARTDQARTASVRRATSARRYARRVREEAD